MKTGTKRVLWGLFVALIAILIIVNLRWSSDWAPRPDLEFRIVSAVPCASCLEMEQATGPNKKITVYLEPPFATSADISSIRANARGNPVIDFKFKPEARDRIRDVTSRNVGHEMVVLSGRNVVEISMLSGPFSDSMRMSDLTPEIHKEIFFSVVKTDRNATSDPERNR